MTRPSLAEMSVWCLAVAMIAAVVHISSIFLLPAVAARDSFVRLTPASAAAGFALLPPPEPGDASLPFTDPGTMLAVCRYDLRAGPWRVRVDVDNEALTSLSFYARSGTVFHTLTDRAALRGRLDVMLGTASQVDAAEAADTEDVPVKEVRLVSPTPTGSILIRAMASGRARERALKQRLEAADCRPIE